MSVVDVIQPNLTFFVSAVVHKFMDQRFHPYLDAKYGKDNWPSELELADLTMFSGMSNAYGWINAMGERGDDIGEMHLEIMKDYRLDVKYQEIKEQIIYQNNLTFCI